LSSFDEYSLNKSTKPFNKEIFTMDNKKFEQLIDMIINENEEQARELFHDIVVEKSREIYESMMYDEGQNGPQVTDMLDEIDMEETSGMVEDEESDDEFDMDSEEGDDFGGEEDFGDEEGEEEDLEDRVVDLEDKLDELMAEFEELMGSDEGEEDFGDMGDDDMGDEMGDEEMMESEESDDDEEEAVEESLEESVQLKKIPGLYDSKIGGDNGDNTRSTALTGGPKVKSTGAKPVNFTGTSDSGGTKGGLASPDTKDVKGAGQFKNAPGHDKAKTETAPKPKHGDGSNGQNNKSVLESKSVKKRIK
jgi:hypothetical protein